MVMQKELWRKALHVLLGVVMLGGSWWVLEQHGQDALELSLAVLLGFLVLCDVLIADYRWKLPLYAWLERPHEERGFHTVTLAVLTSLLVFKLFALPVAVAAVSMFVFGDAAAALVGMRWGRRKPGKKSLAGTAAMLVVSVIIGWLVFGWIGVAMGIVATVAECAVTRINDAITIPLFAGLAGHLLMRYFL